MIANKTPNPFNERSPDSQEAVFSNLFCRTCKRLAVGSMSPIEYEVAGEIWVEATCMSCEQRVRIRVKDIP